MITIKAYAKINLALNVLDKREDNYHNIDIVTLPIDLHDIIELELYPKKYGTHLTCDNASIICDESNLVYKAYRLMKQKFNFDSGARIKIYKNIPIEAGLGGGSADAAAIINGLIKLKKLNISDEELINLGMEIGSDVPFCLFNKPARMQGKGEKLTFLDVKKDWYVLLIQPNEGLSTKGIYKIADTLPKDIPNIPNLIDGLQSNVDTLIEENMKNGLQNAAISVLPEIQSIIDKLKSLGLNKVLMSGSGSSIFALDDNEKKIKNIAKMFDDDNHSVWITKTRCNTLSKH